LASSHQDPHLSTHLEDEFLKEQAESIFKLTQHVTNLQRVGEGLGVFVFDKELQ
jgi:ferritin heavy chain